MRIAVVVHDYNREGGHSRYAVEVVERIAPLHEVHVFANTFGVRPPVGVLAHHVPAWRARALTTIVTFPVAATLKVRDFDVVHAQGVCLLGANVVTAHICHAAWYDACRGEGRPLTARDALFESIVVALERRLYRRRDPRVIAVSGGVRDDLHRHYACPAEITIIPHGVDHAQFNPSVRDRHRRDVRDRLGLGEADRVFLFVGDVRKGLLRVLHAMQSIPAAQLIVVSSSAVEGYRRTAAALGVAGRVRFAGGSNCVHEFYGASDALVFPTPYDAFGLVLTEAMACGIPVIASRAAGASAWIDHGRSGWLLPQQWSVADLAARMREVVEFPDRARAAGDSAALAVAGLSWDLVARETLKVYETAVQHEAGSMVARSTT